jgi:hypothetical protein
MPDFNNINNSVNTIVIISVVGSLLIMLLVFGRVLLPLLKSSARNSQLIKQGLPAQATILRIWDTGVTVNDNPRVGFLLEVRPMERPAFQAEASMLVSRIAVAQYQPGALVEIRYDPSDSTKVAIVGTVSSQFNNATTPIGNWR